MVTWIDVLTLWKYPKASELAPVLEEIGLDPNKYTYPWELARDLREIIDTERKVIYVKGEWRPLAWYDPIVDFFKWLGEQLWKLLGPVAKYLALVVMGGAITWLASGWYKALGAIPIAVAVYLALKDFGVI